ncbi:WD40-repeat-containing domain protein [Aspergillus cavernicola]|uniref:Mitochondrial division protein 1 n=1 Tax=Aspergillus cavernicola TaxID=176166 RepID=A0ABR4I1S5_9EURO
MVQHSLYLPRSPNPQPTPRWNKQHSWTIRLVSYCTTRQSLASGSSDGTIILWNTETGKELWTLMGHSQRVYLVAFSSDGQTITPGSRDTTIKLRESWRVAGRDDSATTSLEVGLHGVSITMA